MEHNAIQYGDEYQCSTCGKSWGIKDKDIPECKYGSPTLDESPFLREQQLLSQVVGLKTLIKINEHRMNIPCDIDVDWDARRWHTHLNIGKLRDAINTHE